MYLKQENNFNESYEKVTKLIDSLGEGGLINLSKNDFKKIAFLKKSISILSSIDSDQGMEMVVDFLEIFDRYKK